MLQWLRRRRQAARLAQSDAEALIRDHGAEAYSEARHRERDVVLSDGTTMADGRLRTGGVSRSSWQSGPGSGSGSIPRRGWRRTPTFSEIKDPALRGRPLLARRLTHWTD